MRSRIVGRAEQAHVAGPGQARRRGRIIVDLRRRAVRVSITRTLPGWPAARRRLRAARGGRRWPTARRGARPGARAVSRDRHSASWSPRLVPASACTSSMTTADRRANIAAASGSESSSARLSGVVSSRLGGCSRWRRRSVGGVSPVRVSMVMASAISRDRRGQVARDVGGQRLQRADIERVQPGARARRAASTSDGRKPASVLPPPVGAISSTLSPACGGGQHVELVRAAASSRGRRTSRRRVPAMFRHRPDYSGSGAPRDKGALGR